MRIIKRCGSCGTHTTDCPTHGKSNLKFQGIVELGYQGGRRQRRTRTFDREAKARDWGATVEADARHGEYVEPSEQPLERYLEGWLETAHLGRKPSTVRSYKDAFTNHVYPVIGTYKLRELKAPTIRTVYTEMIAKGLTPKTAKNVHAGLRKALGDAVRDGLLRANPADHAFDGIKVTKKQLSSWSTDELGRFLSGLAQHRLADEFEFAALTGCRRGEVLGLRWADVDLDSGVVTIHQTVIRDGKNGIGISTPKSSHSSQPFTLEPGLVDMLKKHRVEQSQRRMALGAAWVDNDLIFDRGDGRWHDPDVMSQRFNALLDGLDVPTIRFHDLRHTIARSLLSSGNSAQLVSQLLRHHSPSFTLHQYGDVDQGQEAAAVADVRRAASGQ
jgi:integrase